MPIEMRILIDVLLLLAIFSVIAYWVWGPSRNHSPWFMDPR